MAEDTLSVEIIVEDGKADVVLSRTKQKLEDFVKTAERAQPNIKFKIDNQGVIDLTKLEKKAEETRAAFAQIAQVRLDNGQINILTKEIVEADARARQLDADIKSIKAELANPNRKSSIAFLTEELRGAEKEVDELNRKLSTLSPVTTGAGPLQGGFRQNGKLAGWQKTQLAYQINDVATMAAMGANPMQILASQGGQIAQIFSPAQIAAFATQYAGLVTVLGAGAVAIGLTYKITGDIRAEAERRLKVEEKIQGAINGQIIAQREGLKLANEQIEADQKQREFQRHLAEGTIESLKREKASLEQLKNLQPAAYPGADGKPVANESFQQTVERLRAVNAQIDALEQKQKSDRADSFNKQWENYKKSSEQRQEFERKQAEERRRSIEKGKEEVKSLEKQYTSLFDSLYEKQNSNNPFVKVFTEADKAIKLVRSSTAGLTDDLKRQALQMQQNINSANLFETRLNNRLSIYDLRAEAENFRNPFDPQAQKKEQGEFIQRFLFNNPNYLFLQGKSALDDETRQKILKQFAPSGLTETSADRFNKNLDNKFNPLYSNFKRLSKDEQSALDRSFIAATSGVNPLDLNAQERERAAIAREREAERRADYEDKAYKIYEKMRDLLDDIKTNTKGLDKIAEKGGEKALKVVVQTDDKTKASLIPAPSQIDTDLSFDTTYGYSNR